MGELKELEAALEVVVRGVVQMHIDVKQRALDLLGQGGCRDDLRVSQVQERLRAQV